MCVVNNLKHFGDFFGQRLMDWVSRIRAIVVQIGLQGGWRGGLQTRGHLRFTITHFQVVPSPLDARLAQRGDKSIGLV